MGLQLLLHSGSRKVVMVLQDGGGLMKPLPSDLQSRPDGLRLGESQSESQLELIPPCVLSDDSKMGEIRHRADMLWIGLKLHQSITEDLNDLIEGFRIPICKVLFA